MKLIIVLFFAGIIVSCGTKNVKSDVENKAPAPSQSPAPAPTPGKNRLTKAIVEDIRRVALSTQMPSSFNIEGEQARNDFFTWIGFCQAAILIDQEAYLRENNTTLNRANAEQRAYIKRGDQRIHEFRSMSFSATSRWRSNLSTAYDLIGAARKGTIKYATHEAAKALLSQHEPFDPRHYVNGCSAGLNSLLEESGYLKVRKRLNKAR